MSFLSRSFDKFIISFWIGISIIALIQLFLSGWFVLTFWFPLALSLLSLSLIQNTQINSELTIWWKNFFIQKSIFWGGVFLLFSSAFYMVSSPIVWDDTGGYHIGNIEWPSDKLTELGIRKSKSGKKENKLYDGQGLYILLHPNGSKYWRIKYRF